MQILMYFFVKKYCTSVSFRPQMGLKPYFFVHKLTKYFFMEASRGDSLQVIIQPIQTFLQP